MQSKSWLHFELFCFNFSKTRNRNQNTTLILSISIFWSQPLDSFQKSKQKHWKTLCFHHFSRPKFTKNSLKTAKQLLSWRSQHLFPLGIITLCLHTPKMQIKSMHMCLCQRATEAHLFRKPSVTEIWKAQVVYSVIWHLFLVVKNRKRIEIFSLLKVVVFCSGGEFLSVAQ